MRIWLNIDLPNATVTAHREFGCASVLDKAPTPRKGVGSLLADGGWLLFDSEREARAYIRENLVGPSEAHGRKVWRQVNCSNCP